jgi:hypothetical protein
MGGSQSTPKITAQDRAILEYASTRFHSTLSPELIQVSSSSATNLSNTRRKCGAVLTLLR